MIIIGNPPFQDKENRGKTQHKIWIDFTKSIYNLMQPNDKLLWLIPQSWGSPSNKILQLLKQNDTKYINFDTGAYFPGVGSSFSDFFLVKSSYSGSTEIIKNNETFNINFSKLLYCPIDINKFSLSIHKKIMFDTKDKMKVNFDYVNCHNILLKTSNTLSKEKTTKHIYPIFHTNKQIWYSSIKQNFSSLPKVLWTRSGYTKPFYDNGKYGITDMGYYILVSGELEGNHISKILNSKVFNYIFTTAKWSGFGNEIVFTNLPNLKSIKNTDFNSICGYFKLTKEEQQYILSYSPIKKIKNVETVAQIKSKERSDMGEVFTPLSKVNEMLSNLGNDDYSDIFFDPACGNGNMIIQIIHYKLQHKMSLKNSLKTTYGIDIRKDNIDECKQRIRKIVLEKNEDYNNYENIINKNITQLDFFTLKDIKDIL